MLIQSLSREDPPEEGKAPHSSILAWRISWTEESGGLQSMGSWKVRHDWSNLALQCVCVCVCVCLAGFVFKWRDLVTKVIGIDTSALWTTCYQPTWLQGNCIGQSMYVFPVHALSTQALQGQFWAVGLFPQPQKVAESDPRAQSCQGRRE